ncbi:MAG: hypothetical protein QM605_16855 [Sphingobium sp.]
MLLTSALVTTVTVAQAKSEGAEIRRTAASVNFNIPAQSLETALIAFARQAGVQLVANPSDLRDFQSTRLVGSFAPSKGADIMLRSLPLSVEWVGSTLVVKPRALVMRTVAPVAVTAQAAPAAARQAESAQTGSGAALGLEEIIVQARRQDENIQKVPLTITAVSEQKLASLGIDDVFELQRVVPALSSYGNNGTYVWLRGLPGIAAYFSDAPFTREATGQYFDSGSVQVLKGPQGTLFGGSSAAGAFVINPNKPVDRFEGSVAATVGTYDRKNLEAMVNVPLTSNLFLRLAGQTYSRRGYLKDIATGKDYFDEKEFTIRPSILFRPTDNLENTLMVQYYHQRTNGYLLSNGKIGAYNPYGAVANYVGQQPGQAGPLDTYLAQEIALGIYRTKGLRVSEGFSGRKVNDLFIVNRTDWDVSDDLRFTNILSYHRRGVRESLDTMPGIGFGPANDPRAIAQRLRSLPYSKAWTEEAKISGKALDGKLDFTVGTFHSWNDGPTPRMNYGLSFDKLTANKSDTHSTSHALYAQGTYDLSSLIEGLSVTAGYRYSWDKLRASREDYDPVVGVPTDELALIQSRSAKAKFKAGSWLFGLQYEPSANMMLYATGSKGYTTGVLNLGAPEGFRVVKPETLTLAEAGVKSSFEVGGVRMRANLSAYYGWYDDVQVSANRLVQVLPPPAPMQSVAVTENAAKGLIRGIEAQFVIMPASWLELTADGAVLRNKYTKYPVYGSDGTVVGTKKDTLFVGAPRLQYNVSATVHLPTPAEYGKISATVNYSAMRHTSWDANRTKYTNTPSIDITEANGFGPLASAYGLTVPVDMIKTFSQLDFVLNWDDFAGVQDLSASLSVTNVANRANKVGTQAWYSTGLKTYAPPPPRMAAVTVRYKF